MNENEKHELDVKRVYVVDESNEAAWSLMLKICRNGVKNGAVIPISKEEFMALKDAVIILDLKICVNS